MTYCQPIGLLTQTCFHIVKERMKDNKILKYKNIIKAVLYCTAVQYEIKNCLHLSIIYFEKRCPTLRFLLSRGYSLGHPNIFYVRASKPRRVALDPVT